VIPRHHCGVGGVITALSTMRRTLQSIEIDYDCSFTIHDTFLHRTLWTRPDTSSQSNHKVPGLCSSPSFEGVDDQSYAYPTPSRPPSSDSLHTQTALSRRHYCAHLTTQSSYMESIIDCSSCHRRVVVSTNLLHYPHQIPKHFVPNRQLFKARTILAPVTAC
jgi:hypothetical protein